ncbi:hypothetical protein ACFQ05_39325 [Amycolatopsis umgeniensis]|uniref:Uncharacterized protein n=1 Tax=Amycolatopsis umgeniensis TaxID=336628 RepID=A0A841AXH9_9PSEU|nr:hypothetical protein [Amycolatopsis umgeniensis]MBB5851351.1 hypothetical protein [Amycolatopsis umgeniensis]
MRVVTDAMREAATDAHPLAASRGRHAALQRIHSAAHYYRLMGQELGAPQTELPYLNDRVIEACCVPGVWR